MYREGTRVPTADEVLGETPIAPVRPGQVIEFDPRHGLPYVRSRPRACVDCAHHRDVERQVVVRRVGEWTLTDVIDHFCARPAQVVGYDVVTGEEKLEPVVEGGRSCRDERSPGPSMPVAAVAEVWDRYSAERARPRCGPDARFFEPPLAQGTRIVATLGPAVVQSPLGGYGEITEGAT